MIIPDMDYTYIGNYIYVFIYVQQNISKRGTNTIIIFGIP